MSTRAITYLMIMLLAACSCTKNMHGDEAACTRENTLWVNFGEAETKVYVDGVTTLLHSDDIFSVFHQSSVNEQWIYVGKDGTTNGKLSLNGKVDRKSEFERIYAVYPWSADASINDGVVTTDLPQTQYFAQMSFGRGAAMLAAVTSSQTLHFRYASGFVRLSLKGNAKIKDIELRTRGGEKISGACTIDMNADSPALTATGASSILLRNLDFSPMTVVGEQDFIFSTAPGTYQEGIEFIITYTTGQIQTVKVTEPVTVKAGNISSPVESSCQQLFSLEANFFIDGQSSVNPFSTAINRDIVPGTTGSTSESADIFLSTDTDRKYPFRFYISNKDKAENLRITRSGLNFGGSVGDYIKFPGIEGMRLAAVRITAGSCSISINGQDAVTIPSNVPVTINLENASGGQACKMEMCQAQYTRIHNIALYYDNEL